MQKALLSLAHAQFASLTIAQFATIVTVVFVRLLYSLSINL